MVKLTNNNCNFFPPLPLYVCGRLKTALVVIPSSVKQTNNQSELIMAMI